MICYKRFLKPEVVMLYCDLGRTQFARRCQDFGVFRNDCGYFLREEPDRMMGTPRALKPREMRCINMASETVIGTAG